MSKHNIKNMLMPRIAMKKYVATIHLERPGHKGMIVRNFHFSIPLKEFEGFQDRDVYVYAKVSKED